ncbi:MAG: thymidine kinase [Candidatus Berkelbacteria bacterium]|nr:thymidine kinase [Candidatus Berkelbacteria bacterium]
MLTLILGPMCSGKSLDLIHFFSKLNYTDRSFKIIQPSANIRDENLQTRQGASLPSIKINSLSEIEKFAMVEYLGLDEVHMFETTTIREARRSLKPILRLLNRGVKIFVSGLDLNYQGKMFNIVQALFELGPNEVKMKNSVCVKCQNMDAAYSQVLNQKGKPITRNLPPILPDDGTYLYEPRCRRCFVRPSD